MSSSPSRLLPACHIAPLRHARWLQQNSCQGVIAQEVLLKGFSGGGEIDGWEGDYINLAVLFRES